MCMYFCLSEIFLYVHTYIQLVMEFERVLGTDTLDIETEWKIWARKILAYSRREKKEKLKTLVRSISDESNVDNDGKLSQNYYYKS